MKWIIISSRAYSSDNLSCPSIFPSTFRIPFLPPFFPNRKIPSLHLTVQTGGILSLLPPFQTGGFVSLLPPFKTRGFLVPAFSNRRISVLGLSFLNRKIPFLPPAPPFPSRRILFLAPSCFQTGEFLTLTSPFRTCTNSFLCSLLSI